MSSASDSMPSNNNYFSSCNDVVIFTDECKSPLAINRHSDIVSNGGEGTMNCSGCVRRNPVREARYNNCKRYLQKEHFLEEDFDLMDELAEEEEMSKTKSSVPLTASISEKLKDCPINAHDSNNTKCDNAATIKETHGKQFSKAKTGKRKRKNTTTNKRKAKMKKDENEEDEEEEDDETEDNKESRVPVTELSELIQITFDMMSVFLKSTCSLQADTELNDIYYDLLKNEISLLALLNGFDEKEISNSVGDIFN
ncbi:hypothetical protein ABEB36_002033 [Hypothenemus hampei]|uniref:Uncharacterized protein n=1 Tax=Hypothenemus hampei TaxID=57062 RepID=A0ABD1F4B2_HYPHA